jgi:flagellar basal-body rod protein FlgB
VSGDPLSIAIGARALDGLTMRMAAIAHNLANAGSPRFRSVTVDFEPALRAAAAQGRGALADLRFGFTAGRTYGAGDDRRLDLLIADAAQTAMRYAALVDMLGRRLALRRAALGGQR